MPSMHWQPYATSSGLSKQSMDLDQALLHCVKDQAQSLKYIPLPEATNGPKHSKNHGNSALIWNISLKSPELRTHREIELLTTYLSRSRLLARADMGTLRMAAANIKGIKHLSGSQIIKEGMEHGSQASFRMIIEGQLGVYKTLPESGALTLVASTGPESGIGAELALNSAQNPCNATLVCQTTCLILEVKGEEKYNHAIARAAESAALKVMMGLDQCRVFSDVPRRPDGTIDLIYSVDLVRFKQQEGLPIIGHPQDRAAGGAMYLIQSGTVAIFAEGGSNKHQWNNESERVSTNNCQLVAALGPRELIGEWSLLQQDYSGGRRLHAVAFTVLTAYRITKRDLLRHLVLGPARAESIANVWADRFLSAGVGEVDSTRPAAVAVPAEKDLVLQSLSCSRKPCAVTSSTRRSSMPTGRASDHSSSCGPRTSHTHLPPMVPLPERMRFMAELNGAASSPSSASHQGPPPDRRISTTDAPRPSDTEPLTCQLSSASAEECSSPQQQQEQTEQTAMNRRLLASYPPPGLRQGATRQQRGSLFIPLNAPKLSRKSVSRPRTLPDLQRSNNKPSDASRIIRGGAQLRRITAPKAQLRPRTSSKRIFATEPAEKRPAMARVFFPSQRAGEEAAVLASCGTDHDDQGDSGADGSPEESATAAAAAPPAQSSRWGSENKQQTNKISPRENKTAARATGPSAAPKPGVPLKLGGQVTAANNSSAVVGKLRKKMDYYI